MLTSSSGTVSGQTDSYTAEFTQRGQRVSFNDVLTKMAPVFFLRHSYAQSTKYRTNTATTSFFVQLSYSTLRLGAFDLSLRATKISHQYLLPTYLN